MDTIKLSPEELEIFSYIQESDRNSDNIRRRFAISTTTVRVRVGKLIDLGLVKFYNSPRIFTINKDRKPYSVVEQPASERINPQAKKRKCNMCPRVFKSSWFGQRTCDNCKKTAEWRSGNDIYSLLDK